MVSHSSPNYLSMKLLKNFIIPTSLYLTAKNAMQGRKKRKMAIHSSPNFL